MSARVRRRRRGFTIIEILVAVILLAVGIIAMAGASGVVNRQLGQGRRIGRATQVAQSRLETLRAASRIRTGTPSVRCSHASFASGTATSQGLAERWVVSTPAGMPANRLLVDSVTYQTGRGPARVVLQTMVRCD